MKIVKLEKDSIYFAEVLNIFYSWWGVIKNKSLSEIRNDYDSYGESNLPVIYILLDNDNLIGMYEINEYDDVYTSLTPFLANVYIKEEYRGNGYSKKLIEDAKSRYDVLYLHSRINNYYEKFGFIYLGEFASKYGMKRVYKYEKDD